MHRVIAACFPVLRAVLVEKDKNLAPREGSLIVFTHFDSSFLQFQIIVLEQGVADPEDDDNEDRQQDANGGTQTGVAFSYGITGTEGLHVQVDHGGDDLGIRGNGGEQLRPQEEAGAGDGPHGDVGLEAALQQGKGDVAERHDLVGTVDGGCLEILGSDGFDAGAENGTAGSGYKAARFVHDKIVQNPFLICRNAEKYRHFVQN